MVKIITNEKLTTGCLQTKAKLYAGAANPKFIVANWFVGQVPLWNGIR